MQVFSDGRWVEEENRQRDFIGKEGD